MLNSPAVLLADEPTGNLDQATSALVVDAMRDQALGERAHEQGLLIAAADTEGKPSTSWRVRRSADKAIAKAESRYEKAAKKAALMAVARKRQAKADANAARAGATSAVASALTACQRR